MKHVGNRYSAVGVAVMTAVLTLAQACGAGFANTTAIETQALSPNVQYAGGPITPSPEPTTTVTPEPTASPDVSPTPTSSVSPEPTPTATKSPCPLTAANSAGVGAACTSNSSCGSQAPYCTGEIPGVAAASYCTKDCTSVGACGDNAHCMPDPRNSKLFLCMPDSCIPAGANTNVTPTPLTDCLPAGATGVGQACSSSFDCAFGYLCTGTALPISFCTKLCSNDAACGAGNSCETDPSSGRMACVPNSCLP